MARRKKKNYRLRKSVRRTLGALFMISAIIVAAIPFPDAAAANGDPLAGGNTGGNTRETIKVDPLPDFSYGIDENGNYSNDIGGNTVGKSAYDTSINLGVNLIGPFSSNVLPGTDAYRTEFNNLVQNNVIKSAFTMRYTEDEIWQYEEQYKYYLLDASNNAITSANPDSNSGAVIVKYNNEFSVKDIKLASTINSGSYVKVDASTFDTYFKTDTKHDYLKLTYGDKDNTAKRARFAKYFPQLADDYQDLLDEFKAYDEAVDKTGMDEITTDDVTVQGNPVNVSSELRGKFFCDYVINTIDPYTSINLEDRGFEMVAVEDPTDNSSTIKIWYMARAIDDTSNSAGLRIDKSNGFLYTSTQENTYTLVGIAQGAFSGVTNSMTLELPETIKYIGDEAFKGSFVTEIDITNVEGIGNRAFMGSQLSKVTMNTQTKYIGTEAFSRTLLTNVELPYSILKIGQGAFAHNEFLTNVTINNTNTSLTIGDYAFYECKNLVSQLLGSKKIDSIGACAYAIETIDSGNCTRFEFPNSINDGSQIGKFVLGGRTELQDVVMPNLLGQTTPNNQPTKLDATIFKGCNNLKSVLFPDSCKYVTFDNNIFSEVTNPDFYVQGPEISKGTNPAFPREATWKCLLGIEREDGDIPYVPYVFIDSITGEKFYEVSKGDYRFLIDSNGVLQSCKFVGTATETDLVVPGTVGNIAVTAIDEDCFEEGFIEYIKTLKIEDGGQLKEIANNAFEGATKLESVDIGNSVERIGDQSFKDCTKLYKVTFGKGINLIGAAAFKGCSSLEVVEFEKPDDLTAFTKDRILQDAFQINENENADANLTFIGEIHPQYGPYAYAMDSESFVNRTMGTRICYKTGDPMNLTVILDNRNNYPTLVDYPQYKDLEGIEAYIKGSSAIQTIDDTDVPNTGDNDDQGSGDTDDDSNNDDTSGNTPSTPSDDRIKISLKEKYEKYPDQLSAMENYIIDAIINVVIPEGIESIDVKGFIKDSSLKTDDAAYAKLGNSINVVTYLQNPEIIEPAKLSSYSQFGLFNSDYEDGLTNTANEAIGDPIGNDVVESITMHSVKYLPYNDENISGDILAQHGLAGGAFYDCDNLQTVILGNDMQDVGKLPFLGCHKMNNVVSNSTNTNGELRYVCNNKILYENTDEGTVKLIECLGSRGQNQDGRVNVNSDPDLLNVSELAEGAFSDCPDLKTVSFTDNTLLTSIPDKTFVNDKLLRTVELPANIRNIGQKAFAEGGSGLGVWIYGREVSMATDSFDNTPGATVYTYEDTAAYNTAVRLLGPENVEPIPEGYRVRFFDYDGITELIDVQFVEEGENAIPPEEDPKRDGFIFKGWNKSYKNITEDTDIIALYDIDPNSNDGGSGSGGNGGTGGSGGNGGTGGSGGSGSGGTNVNGGIDTDGDGIPDVDANGNKLYKLTVTNGEGSGYYPAGKTVTIKAGNAPKGSTFAYWNCSKDDLIFEDSTDWITTLTMIASDVTVIANFTGQYTLEVEYGSGSGSYPAGAKVAISAVEAPQGRKFASWVSKTSGLNIENSRKESTVITMPASHAKVTATYMDTGSISGNSTSSKNNTSILITKPGISDKDKASAYVSGSSDNFIVKISESLEAADEVQKALQKKYPDMSRIKYFAMDISLYDAKGVNKITDTTGLKVNITIPIPDALREYAGNNRVGAVVNGELETLNPKFTTISGVPSITFTATHFSPYTIYVDTGNMTVSAGTLDSTPKTGDGIHPKWFLSIGLACISIILFTKRDRRYVGKAYR